MSLDLDVCMHPVHTSSGNTRSYSSPDSPVTPNSLLGELGLRQMGQGPPCVPNVKGMGGTDLEQEVTTSLTHHPSFFLPPNSHLWAYFFC